MDPKVKTAIDGLPFTTEGSQRAKNILKTKYGQMSEILNAYVQNIMALPMITGSHSRKIHEFYEKVLFTVQSLETLGKLTEMNGYVKMSIDKLQGIRGDLVRTDDNWREWGFPKFVEALRKWTERNPIPAEREPPEKLPDRKKPHFPRDRSFQAQQKEERVRGCVYCEKPDHKSVNCKTVASVDERKRVLSNKHLCFNCTGTRHKTVDCRCRVVCEVCQKKHHTSICDRLGEQLMTATSAGKTAVIHPVVVVKVQGVRCCALLDTGVGSSYASAALLKLLKVRPYQREVRQIEMMLGAVTKQVEIFQVQVSSTSGDFYLDTEVTKVDKNQLISLENPRYEQCLATYAHLKGIEMEDKDSKDIMPVHLILGASDYAKIKTETAPRVGALGEPIGEKTKLD